MKHLIHDHENKEYFVVDDENLVPVTIIANVGKCNKLPGDLHSSWYISGVLLRTNSDNPKYFFFYKSTKEKLPPSEINKLSYNYKDYSCYHQTIENSYISKSSAIDLVDDIYTVNELIKLFDLKEY